MCISFLKKKNYYCYSNQENQLWAKLMSLREMYKETALWSRYTLLFILLHLPQAAKIFLAKYKHVYKTFAYYFLGTRGSWGLFEQLINGLTSWPLIHSLTWKWLHVLWTQDESPSSFCLQGIIEHSLSGWTQDEQVIENRFRKNIILNLKIKVKLDIIPIFI